jgi:hypothetical protein
MICVFVLPLPKNRLMSSYVLKIDERKLSSRRLIDYLKSLSITSQDIVFVSQEEKPYSADFVKKILDGEEDLRQGRGRKIEIDELWK